VLTRGRIAALLVLLVVLALGYTAYLAFRTERDLRAAQVSVARLQEAIRTGDERARNDAYADLRQHARAAAGRTDGLWWGALTVLPVIGDDAGGVEALSASLNTLSGEGINPLFQTADDLDGLVDDGQVDLQAVRDLADPVRQAHNAVGRALTQVEDEDSSGYLDIFAERFDTYRDTVESLDAGLGSAETTVELLPQILGSNGPRDYLFVFQNNAEIRASGGIGGAWARIHAEDGRLELLEQGSAPDLNPPDREPVVPLSAGEDEIWGPRLAAYFQNPGLTRDFPRAAQIFDALWARRYPNVQLDGVFALDPVAMSYLLDGTGPIRVGNTTLTGNNIVEILLNRAYVSASPEEQNQLFEDTARVIFETITDDLKQPVDFVQGLAQAGREDRLLYAPFDRSDERVLRDARVLGQLSGDDGDVPHVDVGVNDATASKMSYYLRYRSEVEARSCDDEVQQLAGTMTLRQTISPREAAQLPDYITGTGGAIDKGNQLVGVNIYAPFGGKIGQVRINGQAVDIADDELDGRPVADLAIELSSDKDVVVTWMMETGPGQSGDGQTRITPGIVSGATQSGFASACTS